MQSLDDRTLAFVQKYLGVSSPEECLEGMMRAAYASVSELVIIQMQDFLKVDSSGRINYPSKTSGNWTWRFRKEEVKEEIKRKINDISTVYFRNNHQ